MKKVINRKSEEVLLRYPDLCPLITSITDSYTLSLEPNLTIKAIETPGHKADHMSYMLEQNSQSLLFPGDMILGTPSVSFDCLSSYMESLSKVLKLDPDEILLSHTLPDQDFLIKNAKNKIQSYIRYRRTREQEVIRLIKHCDDLESLFELMYGAKLRQQ